MSLQIKPQNIDVNVHPTKSEVRFLYESNIIECIQKLFTQKLEEHNSSRTFNVAGNVLAAATLQTPAKAKSLGKTNTQSPFTLSQHSQSFSIATNSSQKQKSSQSYVSQSKMVRVDPSVRTLDAFLSPSAGTQKSSPFVAKSDNNDDDDNIDEESVKTDPSTPMKPEKSVVTDNDNKKEMDEGEEEDVQRFSQISSMVNEDDGGVWNKRRRKALDDENEDEDEDNEVININRDDEINDEPQKYRQAKRPKYSTNTSDKRDSYNSPRRKDCCKIISDGRKKADSNYDVDEDSIVRNPKRYDEDNEEYDDVSKDLSAEFQSTQCEEVPRGKNKKDENDEVVNDENVNNNNGDSIDEDEEEISIKLPRRRPRRFKACPLTSVVTQINSFETKSHKGLEGVLSNCIFVGFADPSFVVLQERTGLYICNALTLIQELFFQQVYMRFQNFERIVLKPPLGLRDMLKEAEKTPYLSKLESPVDLDWCYTTIMRMREMLNEYFSIDIDDDGSINALPQIVDGFVPDMIYLPLFVYGLATKVEWQYENECFETIARQLSEFYVPKPPMASSSSSRSESQNKEGSDSGAQDKSTWQKTMQTYEWTIQHMLFPNVKTLLYPPTSYASDGTFVQIAALENLYKVFERC